MQVTMTMEEYKELEGYKQHYINLIKDVMSNNNFIRSDDIDEETLQSISKKVSEQLIGLKIPIVNTHLEPWV
ncbi:hypothetical protein FDA84_14955 [Clostridium botulinum]|nr:hypothetical protein [Clostridium botulinum]